MFVVVGPVLAKLGGYAFDSWGVEEGVSLGYVYRRIEDAYYARNALIKGATFEALPAGGSLFPRADVHTCATLELFLLELTELGVLEPSLELPVRRLRAVA
jgi:hypothetical protein